MKKSTSPARGDTRPTPAWQIAQLPPTHSRQKVANAQRHVWEGQRGNRFLGSQDAPLTVAVGSWFSEDCEHVVREIEQPVFAHAIAGVRGPLVYLARYGRFEIGYVDRIRIRCRDDPDHFAPAKAEVRVDGHLWS